MRKFDIFTVLVFFNCNTSTAENIAEMCNEKDVSIEGQRTIAQLCSKGLVGLDDLNQLTENAPGTVFNLEKVRRKITESGSISWQEFAQWLDLFEFSGLPRFTRSQCS